MKIASAAPAAAAPARAPQPAAAEAKAAPAAGDSLALSKAAPVAPAAKEPMGTVESVLRKTAVVGTIAGGMALTTIVCGMLVGGSGMMAPAIILAGLAADGLMGLLAWHMIKTPLTK
jgi:hypothetical protein